MPTRRRLALITAAALAAATVTVSAGASFGSIARDHRAPSEHHGVVPPATAPHVGHVSGAQYGADLPINNPDAVHAFKVLHRQMLAGSTAPQTRPNTIHEYIGTSFNADTSGAQATQSVSAKIHPAQSGTTLYTPTMYPSGNSCIEVSTAYFHDSQVVAAWDWCRAITFVAQMDINRHFMHTYTKNRNYSVQILQTRKSNNTWTAYLYNYRTGTWETFFTQNGTGQTGLSEGWDIYELYSELDGQGVSYACADLEGKRVAARHIMVGVDGQLVRANPSNAAHDYDVPLTDFHCPSLSYQMVRQYSNWRAVG